MLEIGALESWSQCGPSGAAVLSGQERISVKGEDNQSACLVFVVDGYVKNVLVLETGVRRSKGCAAVFADLHALAFGADNQAVGMIRVDDDGIDNPIAGSDAFKIALVGSLPQAAGGSGVERLRILGILANQLRSAEDERECLCTWSSSARRSRCDKCRSRQWRGHFLDWWDRRRCS